MILTKEHTQQIEKIIAEMKSKNIICRKDHECCKSQFEKLNDVKKIGSLLECPSEDAYFCGLSFSFGASAFCKCPLRRYILQQFAK
jgi:hypothetical protein